MIPQSGKKDAPGIRADTRGQPTRLSHRKAKDKDKTDVFVKRIVGGTNPVDILTVVNRAVRVASLRREGGYQLVQRPSDDRMGF